MDQSIFVFQTMMTTVIGGMSGKMIPAIQTVAYIIMVASLLLGIYEAFAKGGDTRQLVAAVFKYIVVAFIVGNWTTFFNDTMSGFNALAQFIDNSYGGLDLMKDWQTQLSNNWNSNGYNSIWNIITNGGAAIFNALEVALAYIIFPLAVTIFTLIYTFWGAVVYAVGPLVLALAPSRMVNSVAKIYAQNLVVWNCWVVIYAIFSCLISAVNGNSMTISPFFSGNAAAAQPQVWIGMTSILYAICIMLIPVIALAVLKADFTPVGGSLMGLASTAMQVSRMTSRSSGRGGGGGSSSAAGAQQGGLGAGTYRNLSVPPQSTPPRSSTA